MVILKSDKYMFLTQFITNYCCYLSKNKPRTKNPSSKRKKNRKKTPENTHKKKKQRRKPKKTCMSNVFKHYSVTQNCRW